MTVWRCNSAHPQDLVDVFALDITDLASIEYTVASTSQPQSLPETPAIVSRYLMSDMASLGLRTLKDVLSFIPGFNLQDASLGSSTVMVRGITETFNHKVLFLLDDVPYWAPSHSAVPLLGIPISAIDFVEVIRGPGAVIYGTNASTGVIKIVTKRQKNNAAMLAVNDGNRANINSYYHWDLQDKGRFDIAFEVQNNKCYQVEYIDASVPPAFAMPVPPPTRGLQTKKGEFSSFLMNYSLSNFKAGIHVFNFNVTGLAGFSSLANSSSLEFDSFLLHLADSWHLKKTEVTAFTDYNQFYLTIPLENHPFEGSDARFQFDNNSHDNYRWRAGLNAERSFGKLFSIYLGAETEQRSIGNYQIISQSTGQVLGTLVPADTTLENAVFAQGNLQSRNWFLTLGVRYTDSKKSGSKSTPRLAIVYKYDDSRSLKLLYAEGFNSPNFVQQLISIPNAITGHVDLRAESIRSTDLAYSETHDNSLFVANFYYLVAEDFITRLPEDDGNHFRNAKPFHRYGLGLDYQLSYNRWKSFANLSYQHQGNTLLAGDETALFSPRLSVGLGLSFRVTGQHLIGGSYRYIGSRAQADALNLLDVNYEFKLDKFKIYSSIKNVLDAQVLHPDVQNYSKTFLVPGGDNLRFELGLIDF